MLHIERTVSLLYHSGDMLLHRGAGEEFFAHDIACLMPFS